MKRKRTRIAHILRSEASDSNTGGLIKLDTPHRQHMLKILVSETALRQHAEKPNNRGIYYVLSLSRAFPMQIQSEGCKPGRSRDPLPSFRVLSQASSHPCRALLVSGLVGRSAVYSLFPSLLLGFSGGSVQQRSWP